MIHVSIRRHADGHIREVVIDGHANFADKGEDIVCAAVSAVSIGTVQAIEQLLQVALHVQASDDGGYLAFQMPTTVTEKQAEQCALLLDGMAISLRSIADAYDQFIQYKEWE